MKKIKFEKNGKIFTLKAIVCENKDLIKFMNRDYFLKLCKNGCSNYNKNWSCPPNSPKFDEFSADYTNSLLVEVTSEVRTLFSVSEKVFFSPKVFNDTKNTK